MPKLLFVTKYIDHILYFFLKELAQKVDLTILHENKNEWSKRAAEEGLPAIHCFPDARFDRRFRQRIESMTPASGWDLVQSFHGNRQLTNLIRWNRNRLPLIAYRARIGHLKFRENPSVYWAVRNPNIAAVAAVSAEVKRYLESFRIFPVRNVRVLHHGLNPEWIDQQVAQTCPLREQLGIPENALIVASMAALRPVKRFDYIVHAAKKLSDQPVHFVHIGEPRGFDQLAVDLPQVHFMGQQPRPIPVLAAADVFAMTSHNEAFGRANLEAMACSKPVIGSNTGGLLDLVVPDVTGQLFESSDPDSLVACVERYLEDRSLITEHGRNARARVEERFTTADMLERYLALYQDVLSQAAA